MQYHPPSILAGSPLGKVCGSSYYQEKQSEILKSTNTGQALTLQKTLGVGESISTSLFPTYAINPFSLIIF